MSYFDKFNKQQENTEENGRSRGSLENLVGRTCHISRVNRCKSNYSNNAYVFEVTEDSEHYYFGNSAINAVFYQAEQDNMLNEIGSVDVAFTKKMSEKYKKEFVVPVFGETIPF